MRKWTNYYSDEYLVWVLYVLLKYTAAKNECTEQVRKEFAIPEDQVWMKSKSEYIFKQLVKPKAHEQTIEIN